MIPLRSSSVRGRQAHVRITNRGVPFGADVFLVLPGTEEGAYQEIDLTRLLRITDINIDIDANGPPRATISLVDVVFDVLAGVESADSLVRAQLGLTEEGWRDLAAKLQGDA